MAVDGAGNVYVADRGNATIRRVTADGVVTTLAGTAGMPGSADGTGAAARFSGPTSVAVDGAGNVYVVDQGSFTIRKVTADGVVTTLAGTANTSGSADGAGAAARFNFPEGVAVDSSGTVYVADRGNFTVRKITADGVVTTLAGTAGMPGSADGTGAAARFYGPAGVAVDSAGNVYVAEDVNSTLRKITADGVVTTLAGTAGMPGSADGTGTAARFRSLIGVAIDSAGAAYVADAGNETIRKITTAGVVTTLAGTPGMRGSTDGTGADARFGSTGSVAVDGAGNVYVADSRNATIRRVTAGGVVTTLAGTAAKFGSADGAGADARFDEPVGVAVDSAGNAYVADQANATIRKVTPEGVVTTLAGTARMGGSADGTGAAARFGLLGGVAVDSAGNAYATDEAYATIRKVTANGVATTLAGTAGMFGSADGTGAAARFGSPFGVAVDSAGNVDVSDFNNATIRKITAAGVVTTLAGTPFMSGDADGTGSAARFRRPLGMAADSAGNVYVADAGNFIIRKVTATGVVTTLAGTAGMRGSADGTGAAARFSNPAGLAADAAGNIYVADPGNHAIRKVTPMGVTTTIAGTPALAEVVLGATAGLAFPQSLAIVDDSIVIIDGDAILVLRHGARQ